MNTNDYKSDIYAVFDQKGAFKFQAQYMTHIAEELLCQPQAVRRAVKGERRVRGHTVKGFNKNQAIPEKITVEPNAYKRIGKDMRSKRMYMIYKPNGEILEEKLFELHEVMSFLGVICKDTILKSVIKHHRVKKHIVTIYKSPSMDSKPIYPKLSPLSGFFKVFQFNKQGELVAWYTSMTVAAIETGIDYNVILSSVNKNELTDPEYFFTNTIPTTNFKTRKVKFVAKKPARIRIKVQSNKVNKTLSIRKAAKLMDVSYDKLLKKVHAEERFLVNNFIVEKVVN